MPQNSIRAITQTSDGYIWLGTQKGLIRFNGLNFEPFNHQNAKELKTSHITTLFEDNLKFLWIGTWGSGIYCLRKEKLAHYTVKQGVGNNIIRCISGDKNGNTWIGTWGGGLYRFKSDQFIAFTSKDGLSSNIITAIFEDREDCLWIGTDNGRLNRLKNRKFKNYSTREGLSTDMVRTIIQDQSENIWIGTDGGGLNCLQNEKFIIYTTADGLSNNNIRSLFEDKEGTLWIGTYGGGLNLLKDGKFSYYSSENGLSGDFVLSINKDQKGNIWVGTWGDGLNQIKNGKITTYTMKNGLSNNNIMVIHEDRKGNIWIGTGGGGLIQLKNGIFTTYTTKQGLSGNYILSIYEDDEGIFWIGTYNNGLNRFKENKFTSYTIAEGLFNNIIYQILEDKEKNLWMSCNKGIFRVSKKELNNYALGKQTSIKSFNYNKSDGMNSNECNGANQAAGWKSKDGSLWFPTTKGVTVINPSQIKSNSINPPVVIEKVKIDDEFLTPDQISEISPGKQKFEFHYAALSFVAPEKIKFKHKLADIDNNWVEAGTRRVAYYTNLSPGKHIFKVIACNNDGLWNKQGASLEFVLKPMFYQTVWFYGFGALFIFLTATVVHLIRVRQIIIRERKKYEKSRLSPEKTEKYLKKLLQYMKTEQPYLDPDLTLNRLSHETSISIHYISQIVNAQLKQNFFDFINNYRIEEAKKRMKDPKSQNMSILQIAFDVGFNSKSAFNRAFKKYTNMTPSSYKKNF